tara:strand:- start:723 stop:1385 length:663 start_codon:yes stop_codon:yes gene_type:complete
VKHKQLYKRLIEDELSFIPCGVIHLKSIYELVQKRYPLLCDDSCICRDICTKGTKEAEWKHRVRTVLYQLKKKGIIKSTEHRGFWVFGKLTVDTPIAFDIPNGEMEPERRESITYRVLRDTALARKLKLLYENKCQICRNTIYLKSGATYSEAHHIKPLGREHNGPDVAENIVVLCPNHHVMCDYGAIELNLSELYVCSGHDLSETYIQYHNMNIHKNGV